MSFKNEIRFIACLLVLVSLSGCISFSKKGGGYYQDDGPPSNRDIARARNTPDAIPRQEPLSKTGNSPYTVFGKRYVPMKSARGYRAKGVASWYGKKFHGRRTSSGEPYNMYAMSAAHTVLPLPSYVRVTNLRNNRQVVVKVNDRGPFLHNRLIDLSYAAAVRLDMLGTGTANVLVEEVTSAGANNQQPSYTQTNYPAAVEPQPGITIGSGNVVLQVGAFSNEQNALSVKLRLQNIGFNNVFVKRVVNNIQAVIYKVQIGPYLPNQIQVIQQQLSQLGFNVILLPQQ